MCSSYILELRFITYLCEIDVPTPTSFWSSSKFILFEPGVKTCINCSRMNSIHVVANSTPFEGHTHTECYHPPLAITPRRTPKQKCSPPWPTNCQMMLNKLDFSTISPCQRSKSTTSSTQYMYISLFLYK